MHIKILLIGETEQKEFISIENQYIEKIKRYQSIERIVLKDPGKGLKLTAEELKKKEAKLLLERIQASDKVILLDEKGELFSSVDFATKFLAKEMAANTKNLVFVIGGPFGFGEEIISRSSGKISLSRMTFTHQMVRMVFYEQLYRGYSILKGEKYHHE